MGPVADRIPVAEGPGFCVVSREHVGDLGDGEADDAGSMRADSEGKMNLESLIDHLKDFRQDYRLSKEDTDALMSVIGAIRRALADEEARRKIQAQYALQGLLSKQEPMTVDYLRGYLSNCGIQLVEAKESKPWWRVWA